MIDENDFDIINPSEFSKLSVNDNQIEADTSFDVSLLPPPAKNFNQFLRVWVELNTEPIKFAHYFLVNFLIFNFLTFFAFFIIYFSHLI